jgi:hypothetical protein
MTIHVADTTGRYVGSYPGPDIPESCPEGSFAVEATPTHQDAVWDGSAWQVPAAILLAEERALMRCSPLQGQLALGEARWTAVEEYLAHPDTPWAMRRTVQSATYWERTSPDMDVLAWVLGYDDAEVDDLFRLAMTL